MQTRNTSLQTTTPQESILSTTPKPMSVDRLHQELTLKEELQQVSDSKYVPDLYERNLLEPPADTSISVDQKKQQRKEFPREEENNRASESKDVLGLYKNNLPNADTSFSVYQENLQQRKLPLELIRPSDSKYFSDTQTSISQEKRTRPKSSSRPVNAHQNHLKYRKNVRSIKWTFVLLLIATLSSLVNASDCAVMNDWLPEMFSDLGTQCCFQTGITCVSNRITEMYIHTLIIHLVIYTANNSQARSPLHYEISRFSSISASPLTSSMERFRLH
jgi:hypothetical protein